MTTRSGKRIKLRYHSVKSFVASGSILGDTRTSKAISHPLRKFRATPAQPSYEDRGAPRHTPHMLSEIST